MSYSIGSPVQSVGTGLVPGRVDLSDGTFSIQLKAPTGLIADTSFTFPSTIGLPNQAIVNTGGGVGVWGVPGNTNRWFLSDQKPSGTNGGTFTSGVWQTRDINVLTKPSVTGTDVTIAANQIIINDGTYSIYATAPGLGVQDHKTRFQNITDAVTEIIGSSERMNNNRSSISVTNGFLTVVGGPKTYEFQHRCLLTRATDGFGEATGFGDNEVFALVQITKLA